MVRRSLRAGLWLGLLIGLAWSLRRMLLLRRMATRVDVSRDPWTPLPQPTAEPPAAPVETPPAPPPPTAVVTAPAPPPTAAAKAAAPTKAATAGKAAKASPSRTWVAPLDGACPPGHPVKAKTATRIFRVPGMSGYDQTRPDRCYRTEDDALADGFTRAKR